MEFRNIATTIAKAASTLQRAPRAAATEIARPKSPEAPSVAPVVEAPKPPTEAQRGAGEIRGAQESGQQPRQVMEALAGGDIRPTEAPSRYDPQTRQFEPQGPGTGKLEGPEAAARVATGGRTGETGRSQDDMYQDAYDQAVEEMGDEDPSEIAARAGEIYQKMKIKAEGTGTDSKDNKSGKQEQELLKRLDSLPEKQRNQLMERVNSSLRSRIEQQLAQENVSKELIELIRVQSELLAKYAELIGEKDEKKKKLSLTELISAMIIFLGKETWNVMDPLEGLENQR